ncbi:MAG: penicillin-binding protein 2 [Actinomycetes bacterium]
MIEPTGDPGRAPSNVRLGRRMAFVGGVILLLFALLLLRLWYLQVLDGDNYLAKANDNQVRDVALAAPRGRIVDRAGRVLVDSRPANAIVVVPGRLPEIGSPEREQVALKLSRTLDLETAPEPCKLASGTRQLSPLACRIERESAALPYANVVVRKDASTDEAGWVLEHKRELPGVDVSRVWLRTYPEGPVGAQLFGTVGEISAEQLGKPRFAGIKQGTVIGQSGLEYQYDRYLRGRDGAERIQVDATGRARRTLRSSEPVPGKTLRLALDLGLLRTGQSALATAMSLGSGATGAAYIAIDPRDGSVLALGSAPSFDPGVFAKPISQSRYAEMFGAGALYPQLNRAIQSSYPTASTFKAFTALAALGEGVITPATVVDDPGSIKIGNVIFRNAGNQANGPVNLASALRLSSDVYFYRLGAKLNTPKGPGGPIQEWLRRLGFGEETGIDLPGEAAGTIPTPKWRADRKVKEAECAAKRGGPCGLSDGRAWSVGDNVNLSVGQGDFLATPLQLAVAYAAIANRGKVLRPRVAKDVRNDSGLVLQAIRARPARSVAIDAEDRQAILEGLREAAMDDGGTSADVFSDFGRVVYGKTGTAERPGQADQAWYALYIPDRKRPLVVVVTVEQGGFGAQSAAPAARLIASRWFGQKGKLVVGNSRTR